MYDVEGGSFIREAARGKAMQEGGRETASARRPP